jgi:methionyl-tRNA synthetase
MSKFYITTPIFYPNAAPHVGNAYPVVFADVIARYHRLIGDSTYFLTGTDEHTAKTVNAAKKAGKDPKTFSDENVKTFLGFFHDLHISNDQFIRTSDEKVHWSGVQEMWRRLEKSGDIYKGSYEGLYCVGCEAFITEKELVDGKCPQHDAEPEKISEENYFFKLSKYTEQIKDKIESGELKIEPEGRKNEIVSLLEMGLQDISFSRPTKSIAWGIPVPNDPEQTIYVWCDALTNYITALGFGREDDTLFEKFWPADCHLIGKDILRFHAAIWPAMLLSAGIALPKKIFAHGFIVSGGKKMSKSLGNIIDPQKLIKEFGPDALRYYLSREVSPIDDGDLTEERFKEIYNAHLANGIGNVVARIMKMATQYEVSFDEISFENREAVLALDRFAPYHKAFQKLYIHEAADFVWSLIAFMDAYVDETKPFKSIKTDPERAKRDIAQLLEWLWEVAILLEPFIPETADKIQRAIKAHEMPSILFPRKD